MKKMLEYQRLDFEYKKLCKTSQDNEDKLAYEKLNIKKGDFQNQRMKHESNAKGLLQEYNKYKTQYENNYKKLQEMINTKMEDIPLEKIEGYLSQCNSLSHELFLIGRNLDMLKTKIFTTLQDFGKISKQIKQVNDKIVEYKEKCDKQTETIAPKIAELQNKMKLLEEEIPQDLFSKYKAIKADKIFPVFVPLTNGHCRCGVEIPIAKVNKVKSEGMIICEGCHRIIYYNE